MDLIHDAVHFIGTDGDSKPSVSEAVVLDEASSLTDYLFGPIFMRGLEPPASIVRWYGKADDEEPYVRYIETGGPAVYGGETVPFMLAHGPQWHLLLAGNQAIVNNSSAISYVLTKTRAARSNVHEPPPLIVRLLVDKRGVPVQAAVLQLHAAGCPADAMPAGTLAVGPTALAALTGSSLGPRRGGGATRADFIPCLATVKYVLSIDEYRSQLKGMCKEHEWSDSRVLAQATGLTLQPPQDTQADGLPSEALGLAIPGAHSLASLTAASSFVWRRSDPMRYAREAWLACERLGWLPNVVLQRAAQLLQKTDAGSTQASRADPDIVAQLPLSCPWSALGLSPDLAAWTDWLCRHTDAIQMTASVALGNNGDGDDDDHDGDDEDEDEDGGDDEEDDYEDEGEEAADGDRYSAQFRHDHADDHSGDDRGGGGQQSRGLDEDDHDDEDQDVDDEEDSEASGHVPAQPPPRGQQQAGQAPRPATAPPAHGAADDTDAMPMVYPRPCDLQFDPLTLRLRRALDTLSHFDGLQCAQCEHALCDAKAMYPLPAAGLSGFALQFLNPAGHSFRILTARHEGMLGMLVVRGPPTVQATWFTEYAWSQMHCSKCNNHIGWRYDWVGPLSDGPSSLSERRAAASAGEAAASADPSAHSSAAAGGGGPTPPAPRGITEAQLADVEWDAGYYDGPCPEVGMVLTRAHRSMTRFLYGEHLHLPFAKGIGEMFYEPVGLANKLGIDLLSRRTPGSGTASPSATRSHDTAPVHVPGFDLALVETLLAAGYRAFQDRLLARLSDVLDPTVIAMASQFPADVLWQHRSELPPPDRSYIEVRMGPDRAHYHEALWAAARALARDTVDCRHAEDYEGMEGPRSRARARDRLPDHVPGAMRLRDMVPPPPHGMPHCFYGLVASSVKGRRRAA